MLQLESYFKQIKVHQNHIHALKQTFTKCVLYAQHWAKPWGWELSASKKYSSVIILKELNGRANEFVNNQKAGAIRSRQRRNCSSAPAKIKCAQTVFICFIPILEWLDRKCSCKNLSLFLSMVSWWFRKMCEYVMNLLKYIYILRVVKKCFWLYWFKFVWVYTMGTCQHLVEISNVTVAKPLCKHYSSLA